MVSRRPPPVNRAEWQTAIWRPVAHRRRVAGAAFVLQNRFMPYNSVKRGLLFLVLGLSLIWVQPVRAALGSDAASVLTDGAELQGAVNSVPGQLYDIEEITAASGVRVREFLNRNGIVFAVTW